MKTWKKVSREKGGASCVRGRGAGQYGSGESQGIVAGICITVKVQYCSFIIRT